jgi:hypothetical protein
MIIHGDETPLIAAAPAALRFRLAITPRLAHQNRINGERSV